MVVGPLALQSMQQGIPLPVAHDPAIAAVL